MAGVEPITSICGDCGNGNVDLRALVVIALRRLWHLLLDGSPLGQHCPRDRFVRVVQIKGHSGLDLLMRRAYQYFPLQILHQL